MVTMITLHMLCAENREQAVGVLTKNTELAREAKGFVSRNIYFCGNYSGKLSTARPARAI